MDEMSRVIDISLKEIRKITENGRYRSKEDIDMMYKLTDIIKDAKSLGQYSRRMSRDGFAERLEAMMDEAPDEHTRENLRRMLHAM